MAQNAALIDDFESLAAWSAHPSDGVDLKISQDAGRSARAMRLDFDFHRHGGYAIARRNVDLDLPPNYEFTFWMRADAPVNNLEFKLIDASGDNVWWMNRRDFVYPHDWTEIVTRKRQLSFAWGPLGGGEAHHVAAIEIVVTAGTGGAGTVWIDDLALSPLPPPVTGPVTRGSWRASDGAQQLTIDLGVLREIGGLQIRWDDADYARDFSVELSRDGDEFRRVREVVSNGRRDELLYLPDQEARAVRIAMKRSSRGRGYAMRSLEIEPVDWAPTANDFFATVAKSMPRGAYPRYLAGEQPYWTVIGADAAESEALVGEDGNVEPFKGGFSIEPFVTMGERTPRPQRRGASPRGTLVTWADVATRQSLAEGDLPIPSVSWRAPGMSLDLTALVTDASLLRLRYRVKSERDATLFLTVRPFQVNPSTQFLNTTGGVAPIRELDYRDGDVVVNGDRHVHVLTRPARFIAATYDDGEITDVMRSGASRERASDAFGYASGALAFPISKGTHDVELAVCLEGDCHREPANLRSGGGRAGGRDAGDGLALRAIQRPSPSSRGMTESFASARRSAASAWREKVHRVAIEIPGAPEIADTIRTSVAYMLIERDGAALEPGSRSYDRAWIRDGSLISPVLLRLGHVSEAKAFAEWFAGFQFPDGKVPCCVDRRGADPVPENDSHGELIYLVAEVYRTTHDLDFARKLWPHVDAAARYIETLRAANHGDFEGLLTESISHEGYSAKPMHSYWDDVFGVKGLQDAAMLAGVLGFDARQRELAGQAASFRRDLRASMDRSAAEHQVDYVPASAELGDFDPTSTAIGISPLGLTSLMPAESLARTYDEYFGKLGKPRADYTPYEMRIIGALVRLGERDRALQLVDRFMRDRRPAAWNEWAEVVGTDKREPRFIGDMPHAWVASDFVRSILDAVAYEREDGALVIGAGVPRAWIGKGTLHAGAIPVSGGTIDVKMRSEGSRVIVELAGKTTAKTIVVRSPDEAAIGEATVNGRAVEHGAHETIVTKLPARIEFE